MSNKLKVEPDFSDYRIYGLSSHLPDYRVCWEINKETGTDFVYFPPLKIENTNLEFSMYSYSPSELLTYYLVSNYYKEIPWLIKAKLFQYFFIIQGSPLPSQVQELNTKLKAVPNLLLVSELSVSEMKFALPLLANFELHITSIMAELKEKEKQQMPKRQSVRDSRFNK
jgi:hypothetical protein